MKLHDSIDKKINIFTNYPGFFKIYSIFKRFFGFVQCGVS